MKMSGNTILLTGGGSGIGRALAEKLHAAGNQVIITGRNKGRLDDVIAANPGMIAMALDIADPQAIERFSGELIAAHPTLNVVINNAGIMEIEQIAKAPASLADAESTVVTNLLGPIRLTQALLPHLLTQDDAVLMTVSSGLAFVPLASAPTYSATKAGIHAWSMGIRQQLKDTSLQVIELAPPYVQTELLGEFQAHDPNAMPLSEFIDEVMAILTDNPDVEEVIVERCKPLRFAAENGNLRQMFDALASAGH